MTGTHYIGIDVGSTMTKGVLIDGAGNLRARHWAPSGMSFEGAAARVWDSLLKESSLDANEIAHTVATGYGRKNVPFANTVRTEISCQARSVHSEFRTELTLIDIGGQDNKIIRVADGGETVEFQMNRKCAAGTGAFLEEIARRIEIPIGQLQDLATKSRHKVELGSYCTVFSTTEVLTLIRKGTSVPDIVRAAFGAVVGRIVEMDALPGQVVLTGGVVAHNPIVAEILSESIGRKVETPHLPEFTGALGAALLAREMRYSRCKESRTSTDPEKSSKSISPKETL